MESKLKNLLDAIYDLEDVNIPFNIIRQNILPLQKWLETQVPENERSELH